MREPPEKAPGHLSRTETKAGKHPMKGATSSRLHMAPGQPLY
jgi:hypothetical protein